MSKQDDAIKKIRDDIDAIDDKINNLLAKRAEQALRMKHAKNGAKIYRPTREASIFDRMVKNHTGALPEESVRAIFTEIVTSCRNLEERLKIAYLGPIGSYSHEASEKFFGSTSDFLSQDTITDAAKSVESGEADVAFIPIENSSEGSVTESHKLLNATNLTAIGELTLPIRHCLLSSEISDKAVKTVYGHPQALGQCRAWLRKHLPEAKLVEAQSNSQAALKAKDLKHTAAIASAQAAQHYSLKVLHRNISDQLDNKTRFLALSRTGAEPTGKDKTSIICTVQEQAGALFRLLGIFEKHNISLTRLVSQPHPDHRYIFYIDFNGHHADPEVSKVLAELSQVTVTSKIIGSYPRGV